tara:strand:- start:286 stop:717 length:432 start_codon:yes stop_codon:yes gene_type:complete
MQKTIGLVSLLFVLSGCYQTSLAPMIGPAAGASQGRLAYSAVSTSFSYGVKHTTGKFPIEHILKREKEKIIDKVVSIEKEAIERSKLIKEKVVKQKDNLLKVKDKDKAKKLRWVLGVKEIKNVTEEEAFAASKPRYSYWSKQK